MKKNIKYFFWNMNCSLYKNQKNYKYLLSIFEYIDIEYIHRIYID